jgi:hypothetical protein
MYGVTLNDSNRGYIPPFFYELNCVFSIVSLSLTYNIIFKMSRTIFLFLLIITALTVSATPLPEFRLKWPSFKWLRIPRIPHCAWINFRNRERCEDAKALNDELRMLSCEVWSEECNLHNSQADAIRRCRFIATTAWAFKTPDVVEWFEDSGLGAQQGIDIAKKYEGFRGSQESLATNILIECVNWLIQQDESEFERSISVPGVTEGI